MQAWALSGAFSDSVEKTRSLGPFVVWEFRVAGPWGRESLFSSDP